MSRFGSIFCSSGTRTSHCISLSLNFLLGKGKIIMCAVYFYVKDYITQNFIFLPTTLRTLFFKSYSKMHGFCYRLSPSYGIISKMYLSFFLKMKTMKKKYLIVLCDRESSEKFEILSYLRWDDPVGWKGTQKKEVCENFKYFAHLLSLLNLFVLSEKMFPGVWKLLYNRIYSYSNKSG